MHPSCVDVAYFTPEIALSQELHTYAGGLGTVADAIAKAAHTLNYPLAIVTILWQQGYYDQIVGNYSMEVRHTNYRYDFLEDTGVRVSVGVHTNPAVEIKVWKLPEKRYGTCPVYFLDTNLPKNDELAKLITRNLYGGDEKRRLATEIVLGIGGMRALDALDIHPRLYHLNEGQSVLAGIELLRKERASGKNFDEALARVREKVVFTTHTPERAGNEEHHIKLMQEMRCFPGISQSEVLLLGGSGGDVFNMTAFGLRTAQRANGVSRKHTELAQQMWHWVGGCPIIEVLNGVADDWQHPAFANAATALELDAAKYEPKQKLFRYVEARTGRLFNPDILTAVWARRFSEYKRPTLIFQDMHFLEPLFRTGRLQLIVAGKPHYHDGAMMDRWNEIRGRSVYLPSLVILENYEREQSALLKEGADLWIQTSRYPREACGTSGMAANLNGTMILSTKDGWLGQMPKEHHFLYGADHAGPTDAEQDYRDLQSLKELLLRVLDLYYLDPDAWYKKAFAAKQYAEKYLTGERMLRDYDEKLYR